MPKTLRNMPRKCQNTPNPHCRQIVGKLGFNRIALAEKEKSQESRTYRKSNLKSKKGGVVERNPERSLIAKRR